MEVPIDSAIAELASRQHGNVTREQLMRLGLGASAITYRAQVGRLHRVHQGVFAVGHAPLTPVERAAAAVLACGRGAALSHGSALTLWGFAERWRMPLHVSVPGDRRPLGIVTHTRALLTRTDIRTQFGIRVTSPARTFLDCTPDLPAKRLARMAADARRAGKLHLSALADVIARFPNHPGSAHVKALLAAATAAGGPTRSEFEDAFLAFCARFGLPIPLVNTRVLGYEVDAYFPTHKVIVELDGWDFHSDRQAFESDRNRDADVLAAGIATVRVTWERLTATPEREAERLRAILASRASAPGPRSGPRTPRTHRTPQTPRT